MNARAGLLAVLLAAAASHGQSGFAFVTARTLDWVGYHSGALYWRADCLFGSAPRSQDGSIVMGGVLMCLVDPSLPEAGTFYRVRCP